MRVAAYIRVSTQEQAEEGYSVRAQRQKLEAFAVSQGWEIVKFYVDEGLSAKDMNREHLKYMLNDMQHNVFDVVLVYRLDRLTRSVLDLYTLIKQFEAHSVMFKSVTEAYDTTTATGRLFVTLIASLAQWERENLAERVSFGIEQKAREGKWAHNTAPFGYDLDGPDHLKTNSEEAFVVRKIYDHYIDDQFGMAKIARTLNSEGYRTKTNSLWYDQTVGYILKNPLYTGSIRHNYRKNKKNYFEVKGSVPPIIPSEKFEEAQMLLKKRKELHPRQSNSRFIFSGIAKCSLCGGAMSGRSSKMKRKNGKTSESKIYYCNNVSRGTCKMPGTSEKYIDTHFKEFLSSLCVTGALDLAEKKKANEVKVALEQKEIENIHVKIEKKRAMLKKWQYAWANDLMSNEDFKERTKEISDEINALENTLNTLKKSQQKDQTVTVKEIEQLASVWSVLSEDEKRQAVRLIVKSFTIHKKPGTRGVKTVSLKNFVFL